MSQKVVLSRIISVDRARYNETEYLTEALSPAVEALRANQPVGMPTETVYGLAANALKSEAVQQIYTVKNRPSDNPLIVHICGAEMLSGLVDPAFLSQRDSQVWRRYQNVMDAFWPGPLTILFPAAKEVPVVVTAGLKTVGIRFPSHPLSQALIHQAGFPLAAPSANLSGRPSPTTAHHVLTDLHGRIEWIVDGGSCAFGLESTVLDLTISPPVILRPGGITLQQLRQVLPDVVAHHKDNKVDGVDESRPATPGMKYKHYAPSAPVLLFARRSPSLDAVENSKALLPAIKAYVDAHPSSAIVRLTVCKQTRLEPREGYREIVLSEDGDLATIAQRLFGALREADEQHPDVIIAEATVEDAEGMAIMNRLSKAAGEVLHYFD